MKTEYNGIREKVLCAINSHAGILSEYSDYDYIGFEGDATLKLTRLRRGATMEGTKVFWIFRRQIPTFVYEYRCSVAGVEIEISEQEFKEILAEREKQILETQLETIEQLCKNN